MGYSQEDIVEIARTYGEISVFYELAKEGINPRDNAERCLVALGNYRRIVPMEIREGLGIDTGTLEEKCNSFLAQ